MELNGSAQQLWVFIGEADRWHGQSLYMALLETLQRHGCAGATVLRGVAGYGANSLIHTASLVELSSDLPVVVTCVDSAERIARVLPEISEMVGEGMISLSPARVVKYTHRVPGPFPPGIDVADVMTDEVVTAAPETPIHELVERMITRGVLCLPVVDRAGRLLGVITDSDLLGKGAGVLPTAVQREMPSEVQAAEMAALVEQPRVAADVMTSSPVSVGPTTTLAEAASLFAARELRRLPVVAEDGRLVGIVSRSDLLKTVAKALVAERTSPRSRVRLDSRARDAMREGFPTVRGNTPLATALDRLLATTERRLVVVDDEGRLQGVITTGDILRRASRQVHPGALRSLAAWFAGGRRPEGLELAARGRVAADVMSSPVVTVTEDAQVAEALHEMLTRKIKLVPVVDEEGRLVGALERRDILLTLVKPGDTPSPSPAADATQ
jgi:CBS domain-containing protein/PII-like signaling protein